MPARRLAPPLLLNRWANMSPLAPAQPRAGPPGCPRFSECTCDHRKDTLHAATWCPTRERSRAQFGDRRRRMPHHILHIGLSPKMRARFLRLTSSHPQRAAGVSSRPPTAAAAWSVNAPRLPHPHHHPRKTPARFSLHPIRQTHEIQAIARYQGPARVTPESAGLLNLPVLPCSWAGPAPGPSTCFRKHGRGIPRPARKMAPFQA